MNYGKKIQYNELKMKECQGNLKSLYQEWCEKRKVLEMNKKSTGRTAEKIWGDVGILDEINQISDEIDGLLLNTISFFEEMGVSFEAADEKAGRDILEGESGE